MRSARFHAWLAQRPLLQWLREELASGQRHAIRPGIVYALNRHDRHVVRVRRTLRLVCVFNPPLAGAETHDASGAFPADDELAAD